MLRDCKALICRSVQNSLAQIPTKSLALPVPPFQGLRAPLRRIPTLFKYGRQAKEERCEAGELLEVDLIGQNQHRQRTRRAALVRSGKAANGNCLLARQGQRNTNDCKGLELARQRITRTARPAQPSKASSHVGHLPPEPSPRPCRNHSRIGILGVPVVLHACNTLRMELHLTASVSPAAQPMLTSPGAKLRMLPHK